MNAPTLLTIMTNTATTAADVSHLRRFDDAGHLLDLAYQLGRLSVLQALFRSLLNALPPDVKAQCLAAYRDHRKTAQRLARRTNLS